jgi:predicted MarR family transcription regulator
MKTLGKYDKIVRWASKGKTRPLYHMVTELNMKDKKAVLFALNRLVRGGLITFKRAGNDISMRLTKEAYYGRAIFVK